MAFTRFQEYLEKNGLQTKAIVSLDGDTAKYPSSNKPQKAAKKGKNWHLEAAVVDDDNGPLSYQGDGKDPGLQVAGDDEKEKSPPLGSRDVPQKGMVYHPKTDPAQNIDVSLDVKKTKPVNYKANAPAKTVDYDPPKPPRPFNKTENFLNQTSKLAPNAYAEFILKKSTADHVKEATDLSAKIGNNVDTLEVFIREIKRKGNFEKLMEAILNQPEAYKEFALAIASDESKARLIAKTLNETTAKPAVDDDDDDEEEMGMRKKDKVMPKNASSMMPPPDGQTDVRGKPMRPEHTLIKALAGYKNIRNTMVETLKL